MKTVYIWTTLFFYTIINTIQAQQIQQTFEFTIDSIGNARVTIKQSMNAEQWKIWMQETGSNPAAIKRNIERTMPAYILDNFKLERDEINRSFILSMKAYGVCKITNKGLWTLELGSDESSITESTNNKFVAIQSLPLQNGGIFTQTQIYQFPKEAKHITISKNSLGATMFTFEMKNHSRLHYIYYSRFAGILLIIVGGIWYYRRNLKS